MRLISTLCLLLITSFCFAQPVNTQKKIIQIYQSGTTLVDTVTAGFICSRPDLQTGLTGKVAGLNIQSQTKGVFSDERRLMRCYRVISDDTLPLLIVDGVVKKLDTLSKINPNDIFSVDVLKSTSSTALFGPDGVNGALIVTLKQSLIRKFSVNDFLDRTAISGATVAFISANKKDTLYFVANDSGVVITNKLKQSTEYELTVSAVGYAVVKQHFKNGYRYSERNIFVSRDIKTCDGVVLSSTFCPKKMISGCTLYCQTSGLYITAGSGESSKDRIVQGVKIYPNPVRKGGAFNLQFNHEDNADKAVRVLSLDGRILLQETLKTNKGNGLFRVQTDARWAAGIYFIQVIYENGRMLASDKLIIQ